MSLCLILRARTPASTGQEDRLASCDCIRRPCGSIAIGEDQVGAWLQCGIWVRLAAALGQLRASQPRPRGVCLPFKTLRHRGHACISAACQQQT
jgi:hypothetical protein